MNHRHAHHACFARATLVCLTSAICLGGCRGELIKDNSSYLSTEQSVCLGQFQGNVLCLTFAPDGKTLLSGGGVWHGPGECTSWDVEFGQRRLINRSHRLAIWALAYTRNGAVIASGGGDGDLRLWDPAKGEQLGELEGHRLYVHSLSFSLDGKVLVSGGSDCTIRVWDIATRKQRVAFKFPFNEKERYAPIDPTSRPDAPATYTLKEPAIRKVYDVKLSADGKTILAALGEKELYLLNIATGEVKKLDMGHVDGVISLALSPDGSVLATGGGREDKAIRLWDLATFRQRAVLRGHDNTILILRFSPDGKRLASGSIDETARIWDVANAKELLRINWFSRALAFSPDGKLLATAGFVWSGTKETTIKLWDATTGEDRTPAPKPE